MRLTTCYRLQPETFEKLKVFDKKAYFLKINGDVAEAQKNAFNKLGQLEDIEEELGIELVILFNALRNGVYYRMSSGQITKDYVYLITNLMSIGQVNKLDYSFMTCFEKHTLLFTDYGKTWALTKEELKNGND